MRILKYINLILVAVAICSFFLPFAEFQLPLIGRQAVSGFSILNQSLKFKDEIRFQKGEQTPQISIRSLKDMASGKQVGKYLKKKPLYGLIPLGLFCGILAYISIMITGVWVLLRNAALSFITAAASFVFSVFFMLSLLLLNSLLRQEINSSMKKLEGNSFAQFAAAFTQRIQIAPSTAAYLLILTTLLISIFSWQQRNCTKSTK